MEEEVLTPDATAGADLEDPATMRPSAGATPAPLPPPAIVRPSAVKRDWALRSVVKVFVVKVDPNYAQPWSKLPQRSSTGTGFVIDAEKRLLITNAHGER